jgi:transcriptional regulator with XRE-family HTH domain
MDDRTIGLLLRALRRQRRLRQLDVAARAHCSQSLVSAVERGHLAGTTLEVMRRIFGAVEARLVLEARWRGAGAERLLDRDHAAIVEAASRRLVAHGWEVLVEVTYALAGERGSIDVLGVRPDRRSALVAEIKSDIASSEATGRKLDEKRRLAPSIVQTRLGWTPAVVGAVLVLPESPRLRRVLAGPAASLARMFPAASRLVTSWLARPDRPLAATWFLSDTTVRNARRVRRPRGAGSGPADRAPERALNVATGESEPPLRVLR